MSEKRALIRGMAIHPDEDLGNLVDRYAKIPETEEQVGQDDVR